MTSDSTDTWRLRVRLFKFKHTGEGPAGAVVQSDSSSVNVAEVKFAFCRFSEIRIFRMRRMKVHWCLYRGHTYDPSSSDIHRVSCLRSHLVDRTLARLVSETDFQGRSAHRTRPGSPPGPSRTRVGLC